MSDLSETPLSEAPLESDDYEPFTRRHTRLLIILIVGIIVIGLAWMQRQRMSYRDGTAHPLVGTALTGVRLQPSAKDAKIFTEDTLQGKVTLINFWGTWCPPCRQEMPHLLEMFEEFRRDPNFQMLLVSCRGASGQSLKKLREETDKYLSRFPLRPPVYFDENQVTRRRIVELGLSDFGYPTTLILDPQGNIRGLWVGYQPGLEKLQRSLIKRLLRDARMARPAP